MASRGDAMLHILLLATLALAFSTDATIAERQSCDAVQRLAEIEFDPALLVNQVRDNDRYTCVFYVYLPPSVKASDPLRRGAAALHLNAPSPAVGGSPASVVTAIASDLTEGLLAPLKEERFQSTPWKALEQAVRARQRVMEDCVGSILPSRSPLKSVDAVIACGFTGSETKNWPRNRLVIQASLGPVSLALLMPPAN